MSTVDTSVLGPDLGSHCSLPRGTWPGRTTEWMPRASVCAGSHSIGVHGAAGGVATGECGPLTVSPQRTAVSSRPRTLVHDALEEQTPREACFSPRRWPSSLRGGG